jgi:tetratricopeptide (TPR) repeat protein
MSDPQEQRVALAFRERFWSDREAGRDLGLSEYLGLFPGNEEVVAREYLLALSELRSGEGGESVERSEGNRLGPYRLIKELGRGGQGVVWLAEDARLGRKVALKVLSGLGARAESTLARFRREAELASKLDHPGICGVHDTGIEGGVPYIAMRYVDGESLADRVSRLASPAGDFASTVHISLNDDTDALPAKEPAAAAKTSVDRAELDRIVAIFELAANALHAAHEVGIVHRDIKPGNIMISKDGQPLLLDFGLARDDSDHAGPSLTQTGDLFGTPAYMSPEQITGRRVRLDRRSDIYSLGVSLYQCLTLKRPFEAPTRESLYQAILTKEAQPARRLNREIPADLEVVLQCAMAKDRDKRYQTAADFAEDLRRVRCGEPILAKKVSMIGRAWRWSKRRPAAAALLAVLFLGIPTISGLGVWYWTHLDDVRAQERAQILEAVEDQLEIGFYELHHGDPEIALAAFEEALSIDARSPEAAVGLALSHNKMGEREAALQVLERASRMVAAPQALLPVKADVLRSLGKAALADALLLDAPKPDNALTWFIAGTRAMDRGHAVGQETTKGKAAFTEAEGHLHRAALASPRPRRAYLFELAHARGHCECEGAIVAADALQALWPRSAVGWYWSGFSTTAIDPQRSVSALHEAIRLEPDLVKAHFHLGASLSRQGKLDDAIATYRETIRIDPDHAPAHVNLGNSLAKQDKLDEAIAAYREAIRLKPNEASTHYNLGVTLGIQDSLVEAAASYREAIRLKRDYPEAHFNLGDISLRQAKFDEAVAYLREAIRLKVNVEHAHLRLGRALMSLGKFDEAVTAYREATQLHPDDPEAHCRLGDGLDSLGKLDESVAAYREAIRLNPEYSVAHFNLGLTLKKQGKFNESISTFQVAARLDPNNAEVHYTLGLILNTQGNSDDAAAAYREAIRLRPDFVDAHVNLGALLMRRGDLNEGVAAIREAIRLNPNFAPAHINLSVALDKQGKLDEAVTALREAIRLKPELELAHYNVGNILYRQRKFGEAVAANREAIRQTPGFALAHYNLGLALNAQGKHDEAVAAYREALRLNPDHVEAQVSIGNAHQQKGRLDEAIVAYREAVRLNPHFAQAHVNLGGALQRQGKLDEAVDSLGAAIRMNPAHVEAHGRLGGVLAQQGKFAEAIAACREALRLKPDDASGHFQLGTVFGKQGRLDEAIASIQEAVRLAPENQQFQRTLDWALGQRKSSRERVAKLRADIEREPENPRLLNDLAWLLVDPVGDASIREPKEALPLARKAVELSGRRDARILDTLAVALAANSELKEAVIVQEEILKLMNGKDVPNMTVADAEAALERYRKALAASDEGKRR